MSTETAEAAGRRGAAEAKTELPLLPLVCDHPTSHTPLVEGEELSILLKRERGQVDHANDKQGDCAEFYNGLREDLKARAVE